MQLPSVERTASWPPAAAGTHSGIGAAAPKAESALIQEATAKVEAVASKPEPSTKVDISTTQQEIAALEAAARLRASIQPAAKEKADEAGGIKAVADVGSTAANAATAAVSAATAEAKKLQDPVQSAAPEDTAKTAKLVDAGKEPGPNQPTTTEKGPSKDWTTTPQASDKKVENPPPEPLSKKLLDFLQALWRAGGNAVDVNNQATNQVLNSEKQSEGPLTYSDPTVVKKTSSSV